MSVTPGVDVAKDGNAGVPLRPSVTSVDVLFAPEQDCSVLWGYLDHRFSSLWFIPDFTHVLLGNSIQKDCDLCLDQRP